MSKNRDWNWLVELEICMKPNAFIQLGHSTSLGYIWLESRLKSTGSESKMKDLVVLNRFDSAFFKIDFNTFQIIQNAKAYVKFNEFYNLMKITWREYLHENNLSWIILNMHAFCKRSQYRNLNGKVSHDQSCGLDQYNEILWFVGSCLQLKWVERHNWSSAQFKIVAIVIFSWFFIKSTNICAWIENSAV